MALYVNVAMVHQSGDIGGAGMARYHAETASGLAMATADVQAWHTALHTLYNALQSHYPSDITFVIDPEVQVLEVDNAGLIGIVVNPTPVSNVSGIGAGNYAAGTGTRVNWHTNTIKNRRFIRGATFFNPLVSTSFTTGGAIDSGWESTLGTALAAYLNAINAAGLVPVIYSRPTKAAPMTGATGAVTAGTINNAPSSLRSRRS